MKEQPQDNSSTIRLLIYLKPHHWPDLAGD